MTGRIACSSQATRPSTIPRASPSTSAIAKPTSVSSSVTRASDQKFLDCTSSRTPRSTSSGWGSTKGDTLKIAITSFQIATITTTATAVLIQGRSLPARSVIRSPLPHDRRAPRPR